MNGFDKWRSLKDTVFAPPQTKQFPELEQLSFEELTAKGNIARDWIQLHPTHANILEARRKYNWIVHYWNKKRPADLTVNEIFGYLL